MWCLHSPWDKHTVCLQGGDGNIGIFSGDLSYLQVKLLGVLVVEEKCENHITLLFAGFKVTCSLWRMKKKGNFKKNQTVFCFVIKVLFLQVIKEGKAITGDLGGSAKCSEFTEEIIRKIEQSWSRQDYFLHRLSSERCSMTSALPLPWMAIQRKVIMSTRQKCARCFLLQCWHCFHS